MIEETKVCLKSDYSLTTLGKKFLRMKLFL